ncbi:corrinoid protein [Candidatus Hecatella orcuttiae]|jgi:trimethylamine corrinoid protein|uniref:corrinoid protein n=1 Tax=Candidatus Hecatella orcuttiae TaxID=1935119 RepID=UPI002867B5F7|nr:corrinoid protein [Candidatus Hecatella orcuttiae]
MSKEEIFNKLKRAIEEMDVSAAVEGAKEALKAGIDPYEAITQGLAKGMETISDRFDKGELYLPQIVLAADAMSEATKILEEKMTTAQAEKAKLGKVVIGTPEGDIHEIGKNLVATMLRGAGFEVVDIGRDVPIAEFLKKVKEIDADIVAASTLMTTTRPAQKEIVDALKEAGLRDRVKTLHGGAPVSREYVEQIAGDGYAADAAEAVKVAKNLVGR